MRRCAEATAPSYCSVGGGLLGRVDEVGDDVVPCVPGKIRSGDALLNMVWGWNGNDKGGTNKSSLSGDKIHVCDLVNFMKCFAICTKKQPL